MKSKNPFDIANYFRANGNSFHAKACFFRETGEDENGDGKPMQVFNRFSRIVITITEKNNDCKFVEGNIQYNDLAELVARAKFALEQVLKKDLYPVISNEEDSPAYSYIIPSGNLRGKTPAQVLQEPDGEKKLNEQYQFLQDNLANYPKNKIQMDAIMDAARLKNEGKLVKKESNCGIIPILKSEPHPNIYTMNADGTFPVYEIQIECNLSMDSPFEVKIVNYDAPVEEIVNYDAPVEEVTKNGAKRLTKPGKTGNKIKAIKKEAKNFHSKIFKLNMGEFTSLLDHIELSKQVFLNSYSAVLMKEAIEADNENRKNAKK